MERVGAAAGDQRVGIDRVARGLAQLLPFLVSQPWAKTLVGIGSCAACSIAGQ
jgi:hypothetical protein